jgi:DNA-binding NarL/FixJ family response regulator
MNNRSAGEIIPGTAKRILLVEEQALARLGLRTALGKDHRYAVCGEAEDRHEALERIVALKPDLVTVDLKLKSSNGLELIKDIRARHPGTLMLVVSAHDGLLQVQQGLNAGAHGFLTKQEPLPQVLSAVECVFAGEIYISPKLATKMAVKMAGHAANCGVSAGQELTDRESQVLELTGEGLSVRQISERMNIGISTVETYRNRIREKLCLNSASELLQTAISWNRTGQFNGVSDTPESRETGGLTRLAAVA